MPAAIFRFYAELNDFLPPERRFRAFRLEFQGRQTAKHLIESLGVPHTEVDLVLVEGESVSFSEPVEDGVRVAVYPVFEAFDIAGVTRVRAAPLREPRFLLDTHLGRLAAYLRMLGFDAIYGQGWDDRRLAEESAAGRRILLTRDRGLLMRSAVTHGYAIRESNARRQLAEVVERFDLARLAAPFTRCMACNSVLEAASREDVSPRVPPASRASHDSFRRCPGCERVYWDGSHHRRMTALIGSVAEHMPLRGR